MIKIKLWTLLLILLLTVLIGSASAELNETEQLGKKIFFDKISNPDSMACAKCHAPQVGFTGPIPGINLKGSVYRGAMPQRFGNRKPPSAAYATLSPVFHYDEEEDLFIGGNFWDGRATGEILGNPAADQAMGPFLNPVEHNNPSKLAVLEQIASSKYVGLWEAVWGPMSLDTQEEIDESYGNVGLSIAAYEDSSEVNQFSSKYDANLKGEAELTEEEAWGLELFNGKAMCSNCHPSEPGPYSDHPLFTDFTFDNLGIPRNPDNPVYDTEGRDWVDPGLGGFLETREEWNDTFNVTENMGKHKVPTLRNVALKPGNGFTKAYGHNGYFKSLEGIVHFYNTRDVLAGECDPFTTEKNALKMGCWPEPEVPINVNEDELGNLRLNVTEEKAIVAFLKTLSDGYYVPEVP
ncbi:MULTISPECIES: cytochrome-c peroxidase [unclassified Methanosarcina]|uniref:cytochrome-c peroxidase n=1 Tax=unclassified Methanosarcina TaxID=2644672 RepID=UPI000615DA9D|nr:MULTISPECIES: cytochrome c peroxidase [unclassified Methanosarcina]AKB18244.1 Cytochrome c551 peroxidase [Methanosarcina sp. WWM596]AKB21568.1 Cytochrome c551 peroxidase [Methanosarcina sp. WH1]